MLKLTPMPNWTVSIEDRVANSGHAIMQTAPDKAVSNMKVSVAEFIMFPTQIHECAGAPANST